MIAVRPSSNTTSFVPLSLFYGTSEFDVFVTSNNQNRKFVNTFFFLFLCSYKHFLQDLAANTSPDDPEFEQLSGKSETH